jgi:hypothetical protein
LRGSKKLDWFVKFLLIVIALLLEVVAFRPVVRPAPVLAQGGSPYRFHIEQGAVSLKKPDGTVTWGKVGGRHAQRRRLGISLKAQNTPSPVSGTGDASKVSHPIYLGRMAFDEVTSH